MIHPTEMPNDLQIARQAHLKPLTEIASDMGSGQDLLEPYGTAVAKVKLEAIEELTDRPKAKYVVVSAYHPYASGRGEDHYYRGVGTGLLTYRQEGDRGYKGCTASLRWWP
jgi:formate--tetrahydrofolate ligase